MSHLHAHLTHLEEVRGMEGVKEATVQLGDDVTLSVAVVHGGKNTRDFPQRFERKWLNTMTLSKFMACPGGCIGGRWSNRSALNYHKP